VDAVTEWHLLRVTSDPDALGGLGYEIVHPADCAYEDSPEFARHYLCGVGAQWAGAGADSIRDRENLQAGHLYLVWAEVEHTPSLPTNGGEEWDAWLEVADITPAPRPGWCRRLWWFCGYDLGLYRLNWWWRNLGWRRRQAA
jgi:hypothetical protein